MRHQRPFPRPRLPPVASRTDRARGHGERWLRAGLALLLAPVSIQPLQAQPVPAGPPTRDSLPSTTWIVRETFLMGTALRVEVGARDRRAAIEASEAAIETVREVEERLSTWRPDTELAAVNAAPLGEAVRVSSYLFELLVEVRAWSRETGGTFDPAVGALIEAWDLRGTGHRPSPSELSRAMAASGFDCFALDRRDGSVRRRCREAWIDAGAFGKGAALREARRALERAEVTGALLDFGGQLLLVGEPREGAGSTLTIAHPARRREPALALRLVPGSVATAGQSERGLETDAGRIGHVLDPRTGRSVPAWGSVTVAADDPLVADLISTALLVMGPSAGLEWAEGRPGIAALFLVDGDTGPVARVTASMRRLLVPDEGPEPRGTAETVEVGTAVPRW